MLIAAALLATGSGRTQPQVLSGVVGNGGTFATGGDDLVVGTVGQPAPGSSSGGTYGVVGGFWSQPITVITEITEPGSHLLPSVYSLDQNFPNPFNPMTVIQYQLPQNAYVSLKVYDIVGRLVTTLVDGAEEAGFKSVTLDARNLASGVYFYRLQAQITGETGASSFVDVKKLVLMK
jgi:hypothetical protein